MRLQYVIIDLGAAVAIKTKSESDESSEHHSEFTAVAFTDQFTSVAAQRMPFGTVPFMSPEHIDPDRDVDGRADIFSLGVTMYVCLCGRFPFLQPGSYPDIKMLAVKLIQRYAMLEEADPLKIHDTEGHPRDKEEVVSVVSKSLRKLRTQRYESADAMRKHLELIYR